MVPVADHVEMLNRQFLVNMLRPSHPSHAVVMTPRGLHAMKETLVSRHGDSVAPYLSNGIVDPAAYGETLKKIHTDAIAASIVKLSVENPVLGAVPPEPDTSEKRLSRVQRTTLSQLRSGNCKFLNDYKLLLGHTESALCPECLFRRRTVRHIFEC